ncbi:3-galactosyl-N-acetylglucosaminide 4-alpha-L-fucosyltransferase FUT3-like [Xenia sp. Carnegie-2017]|uniref:3-galactosyl-N-acetylglucosaminide 4-alpha-L-fucosyltransferase FUT3-like n=1 Tax=Xenia sp. Carnegie-2017 TaxID=2897299 RepID=UPI001F03476E|nr:3-galactosyl-N-acetylglucosaminide 4-alpha-L-fucosyltransferase FUT3-like [Xenia sp. Carnegie-2017]
MLQRLLIGFCFFRSSYRKLSITISIVVVLCFTCSLLFEIEYAPKKLVYKHVRFDEKHECVENATTSYNGAKKLILFYTTIFEDLPIFHTDTLRWRCCQPFNCHITTDKSRFGESDAVVFHARDLPSAEHMPLKERRTSQRWIYFTMECPYYSKIIPKDYNGMFNWTMTYDRRSDIHQPYGSYTKKLIEDKASKDMLTHFPSSCLGMQRNFATGKDKLLVLVQSHCKTIDGIRENFFHALNKIVKVDVYGKCGGVFGRVACPRWSKKCAEKLKRYKFYISLENSICEDYITEKYWKAAFDINAVPIVFGLSFFKELAIPGSYIDASAFPTLNGLVEYIKYLDKNNTAYNEYFAWRQHYKVTNLEPWPCRLCKMLHNKSLPLKTYQDFDEYFDAEKVCRSLSRTIIF